MIHMEWSRSDARGGMVRRFFVLAAVLLAWSFVLSGTLVRAEENPPSTFQILARAEKIVYGDTKGGGLIDRLNGIEKDLFGRGLPGSISDRQTALVSFLEKGNAGQPSLLFKLAVAEWVLSQRIRSGDAVAQRIDALETQLEGTSLQDKPMSMRLERVLSLLLSEAVQWKDVEVPAALVLRSELARKLSPSTSKVGDEVMLTLRQDVVVESHLVAGRGSRIVGKVTEVSKPRSFGRAAEVKVVMEKLLPLGPEEIPVTIGEEAKKASQAESAQIAAAGTSFLGAILLGPLGLAGGFLVRGNVKEIPEGTPIYVQTVGAFRASGYPIPAGLESVVRDQNSAPDVPASADAEPTPVERGGEDPARSK